MRKNAPRSKTRRQDIIDSSSKLFEVRGYQQTSIDDIVGSLGLAKGTFYKYFYSKDTLLSAVVDNTIDKDIAVMEIIEKNQKRTSTEKLRDIRLILGRRYQDSYGILREQVFLQSAELKFDWLVKSVVRKSEVVFRIIDEGIQRGEFQGERARQVAELATVAAIFWLNPSILYCEIDEYMLKLKTLEEMLESGLGLDNGALNFITSGR